MNKPLGMDVLNSKTDLVKDGLGFDGPDTRVETAVHLEPVSKALLLAKLHHDVKVRPRPDRLVPDYRLANVLNHSNIWHHSIKIKRIECDEFGVHIFIRIVHMADEIWQRQHKVTTKRWKKNFALGHNSTQKVDF